jgi:hypothetical protein
MIEFRLSLRSHEFTDVTPCPDVSLVQRDLTSYANIFLQKINMRGKSIVSATSNKQTNTRY